MKNKVLIISGLRMLLIYFLIFGTNLRDCMLILDGSIKLKNLPQNIATIRVGKAKGLFSLIVNNIYLYLKFTFLLYTKLDRTKLKIYGADHILGAKFFLKRFSFFLIEDGTINYSEKAYVRSLKNKLFSIPAFGMYKNVKKVYLTLEHPKLPTTIQEKLEIINIKELWEQTSLYEKEKILNIFGIDSGFISSLENKKYILYTQPLSEDGILSEEEKISIYRDIINNYKIEKNNFIIKSHPREKTDYSQYFPECFIVKNEIPAELISLLLPIFEKVITLFSTSVYEYDIKLIDFYGTEFNKKLVDKFGVIKFTPYS